jgi:hypothetical protein
MTETSGVNSVADKFKKLDQNFNQSFLVTLWQIRGIVEGDTEPKEVQQFHLLDQAYSRWYAKLTTQVGDTANMEACESFYKAVDAYHELLMKRDTQLFTIDGDFLAKIFDEEGLDTPYLFDLLDDGTGEASQDAKENLWTTITSLYRLCVLIMVYLRMPLVREIIDLIIVSNPDITQSNIFEKIFNDFKGKRRLRKLIMKLLKSKEDSFELIFDSLQKVIATFSTEVSTDGNLQQSVDLAQKKVHEGVSAILAGCQVNHLSSEQVEQFVTALQNKNVEAQRELVPNADQLAAVQEQYRSRNLDKVNVNQMKDLGSTMSEMMNALKNQDEDAVQRVLERAGGGLNLNPADLERMQQDLEMDEAEDDDKDEIKE